MGCTSAFPELKGVKSDQQMTENKDSQNHNKMQKKSKFTKTYKIVGE